MYSYTLDENVEQKLSGKIFYNHLIRNYTGKIMAPLMDPRKHLPPLGPYKNFALPHSKPSQKILPLRTNICPPPRRIAPLATYILFFCNVKQDGQRCQIETCDG